MKYFLSCCLLALCAFSPTVLQTQSAASTALSILTGTVRDAQEALIAATIRVQAQGQSPFLAVTDGIGQYRLQLPPGTYDVTCSYTGYETMTYQKVVVAADKITVLDFLMQSNTEISEVVVMEYKVPLVKQDDTSGGQTLTSEQIKSLPTRRVNQIVATPAGSTPIDGGAINIGGARANGTNYYIDGVRVAGATAPVSATEKKEEQPKILYDWAEAPVEREKTVRRDSVWPENSQEQYKQIVENPFLRAEGNPVSTFSIDVDAASYANIRRFIRAGQRPPTDAVRIEEMINYFDYRFPYRYNEHPFNLHTETAPCPWEPKHRLLMVQLQGMPIDTAQLPPSNFVFLVDVSGSMASPDKLPLVQASLRLLTQQLRPQDRVALVAYAGAAGLVLPSTSGAQKPLIQNAIDALQSGGSTAGGEGIQLAYRVAREHFLPNGNNRVVLCTDGDFNVGLSSEGELVQLIEKERESGVYLTVLGYGTGNYQDGKMQELADRGNGNHAYIDSYQEAEKVLAKEFGATLFAIAKDVKLQLEFNPAQVAAYRLIGYENRLLAKEDFDNDQKDAGELGAGHRVTALYEWVPAGAELPTLAKAETPKNQDLHFATTNQANAAAPNGDLVWLKLRYKKTKGSDKSLLLEQPVSATQGAAPSEQLRLAAAVAGFGLLLRDSPHKGAASFTWALSEVEDLAKYDPEGYKTELANLIRAMMAR